MKHPHIVRRARKKASQSICKFKVAALGFNRDGVCVMARTNRPMFNRKGGGIHAEARLLAVAQKKGIVEILICRVSPGGTFLLIHPCSTCQAIADKLGVKIHTVETNHEANKL